ncbi:hypothetical protein NLI96_g8919 [Meripilus lineatus]|uniref:Uncharacterized protein n=1 Tax=Meripilus lineatus TaxID=2056292 RepID=A0AAD5YBK2_9APHY|nr:hypothetical protein NLI96_g8919 [Physisporinus lineatus]
MTTDENKKALGHKLGPITDTHRPISPMTSNVCFTPTEIPTPITTRPTDSSNFQSTVIETISPSNSTGIVLGTIPSDAFPHPIRSLSVALQLDTPIPRDTPWIFPKFRPFFRVPSFQTLLHTLLHAASGGIHGTPPVADAADTDISMVKMLQDAGSRESGTVKNLRMQSDSTRSFGQP